MVNLFDLIVLSAFEEDIKRECMREYEKHRKEQEFWEEYNEQQIERAAMLRNYMSRSEMDDWGIP